VIHAPKPLDETAEELLQEIARGRPIHRGSRKPVQWEIQFSLHPATKKLQASLRAPPAPILNLDWHARTSKDARGALVQPGYHVDVHPPLVLPPPDKFRLDQQPGSNAGALELLCQAWNLRLKSGTEQTSLFL
jgi:hypothetical protein